MHDFAPAMRYLREHSQESNANKYTGFYRHEQIASDELSEYFRGTLIDENGI